MNSGDKYNSDDPYFAPELGILRNLLGITSQEELERQEKVALVEAYNQVVLKYSEKDSLTETDICNLHRLFLGRIFRWAGEYRKVDISSEQIRWCHALYIPKEMEAYGQRLKKLTPFSPALAREEILARLAELHGELIIIHPFRDGNGRTTRLLCDLLLMQAGYPPIQFGAFNDQEIRKEYHAAVRWLWAKLDYGPLIKLLDRLVV